MLITSCESLRRKQFFWIFPITCASAGRQISRFRKSFNAILLHRLVLFQTSVAAAVQLKDVYSVNAWFDRSSINYHLHSPALTITHFYCISGAWTIINSYQFRLRKERGCVLSIRHAVNASAWLWLSAYSHSHSLHSSIRHRMHQIGSLSIAYGAIGSED